MPGGVNRPPKRYKKTVPTALDTFQAGRTAVSELYMKATRMRVQRVRLFHSPFPFGPTVGNSLTIVCSGLVISLFRVPVSAQTLIDYFQPTPIVNPLTAETWGAPNILPRDIDNGLEDKENRSYSYWDGKILKDRNGKYHLFGSRWDQSGGHYAWGSSVAIHAVSDNILGPYIDKGLIYTEQDGRGHNVTALALRDGTYAVLICETRPAGIYTAASLDGPWTYYGDMIIDANGYSTAGINSNISIVEREDGSFLAVSRPGRMMVSTGGILGPYVIQGNSVWPDIEGLDNATAEDPVMWYSGNKYHITLNWWDVRQARHLMSENGLTGWEDQGVAYKPESDFIRYTDGTVNRWNKIERPNVVIDRNGHVTHFTFAVIDVDKGNDNGDDNHNSKIIVVPFDGLQFDIANGWTPTGTTGGVTAPLQKTSLFSLHGIRRRINCTGYHPVNAEVTFHSLDGKEVYRKRFTLSDGNVSAIRSGLKGHPRGACIFNLMVDGRHRKTGRFIRY